MSTWHKPFYSWYAESHAFMPHSLDSMKGATFDCLSVNFIYMSRQWKARKMRDNVYLHWSDLHSHIKLLRAVQPSTFHLKTCHTKYIQPFWLGSPGDTKHGSLFNLFKPNGMVHSCQLDQTISDLRVVGGISYLHSNFNRTWCKQQWRPCFDAAFYGVWSGSALFVFVPQ